MHPRQSTSILTSPLILLLLLWSVNCLHGQSQKDIGPDPAFQTFTGTVFSMPTVAVATSKLKTVQQYYDDNIYDYEVLGTIELRRIDIHETDTETGRFPGVAKTTRFCMVLKSTMTIEEKGCYEFSLNSDDGSILWIDGAIAVDNDGAHQMTKIKDTVALDPGEYDIKLWYFQALADRFGLVMTSKAIRVDSSCRSIKNRTLSFDFQNSVLFNFGESRLTANAFRELEKVTNEIGELKVTSIEVIGHTDNLGSDESNLQLSTKRAETISQELMTILNDESIKFDVIGKGESEPKVQNDTEDGREQNRRVQIIVHTSGKQ